MVRSITLTIAMYLVVINSASAQWSTISHSNERRYEATTVLHEGKMVVLNGFDHRVDIVNSVETYDPATSLWTQRSSTEVALENAVTHAGNVLIGDDIWLIGGLVGQYPGYASDKVWIYNIKENTWREGPGLPKPFAGGGAAVVNNRIHVFGGLDSQTRCDVDNHFIYDTTNTDGFQDVTTTVPMPMARNHFSTVVFNNKIYALGGQNHHDRCSKGRTKEVDHAHVFDPETNTWSRLEDLPFPRSHAEPGSFEHNNKIYIVGGKTNGKKILTYHAWDDSWHVEEELELPVALMAPSARIFDNKLIVAMGGETLNTNASTATREYILIDDEHPDIPTPTEPQPWSDSYSVDGQCYCDSSYDHEVGDIVFPTPVGNKTVLQICTDINEKLGFGAPSGRVYYNTIQCGHEPANTAQINDEWLCPGIPAGPGNYTGPRCFEGGSLWNLDALYDIDVVPAKPVLISPIDRSKVASGTPVSLEFQTVTDTFKYVVQRFDRTKIKWDYSRTHNASDICVEDICRVDVSGMEPQQNAAWRVQAISETGPGEFSNNAYFHVEGPAAPTSPVPVSPVNRANILENTPVQLVFTTVPGTLQYTVQRFDRTVLDWTYSHTHDAESICNNDTCSVSVSGTKPQINAAWRVRSIDEHSIGLFSPLAYFDVLSTELKAVPLSPVNNAKVSANTPVQLSFPEVDGAHSYTVQRFDRTLLRWNYSQTLNADSICNSGICVVEVDGMQPQLNAAWRVRVVDNNFDSGPFSDLALFDVVSVVE